MSNQVHDSEQNKAYKRFVILTEEDTSRKQDTSSLLLFIGQPEGVQPLLKEFFLRVAFVETALEAIPFFHSTLPGSPTAVLSDTVFHLEQLASFLQKRGKKERYEALPHILLTTESLQACPPAGIPRPVVDEIIWKDKLTGEQVAAKIDFWIKLKSAIHSFNEEKKIILPDFYAQGGPSWSFTRWMDICIACIGLIAALPVMLIIALLIKLDSPGPIFYTAPRAGRGYRIFSFYKFRTMVVGADAQLAALMSQNAYRLDAGEGAMFFKMQDDPRSTRLGKWLRQSSLDELPQLLNVIKGDIALIGNRPLPLEEARTLTTDKWSERYLPPSGIVSLWHIERADKQQPTVADRLHYDLLYARKQHFLLDLWILIRTPWWMLGGKNK